MTKKFQVEMDAGAIMNSIRPDTPFAPIPEPPAPTPVEDRREEQPGNLPLAPKSREASRSKISETEDEYLQLFIRDTDMSARTGKLVYVRQDYHDRIQRIIQVIGKNKLSLFGYIDHVLAQHFAQYEDKIKRLYKKHYEEVY